MNVTRAGTAIVGAFAAVVALVVGLAVLAGSAPPANGQQLAPGSVPEQYLQMVLAAGAQCAAAPAPIIAAQIDAESGWNPRAVSPAGAQGIAQFMPATWASWGRDVDGNGAASPFDPADAIDAQGRYDCDLAARLQPLLASGAVHGDLTDLMLAAYNAGLGAVTAAGGIPAFAETQAYVQRIRTLAQRYTALTPQTGAGFGAAVVAAALPWAGKAPYVWGGGDIHGPTAGAGSGGVGFDCSGLVLYAVYQASGGRITLPHYADTQVRLGTPVPLGQLRPGDVIAFTNPGEKTAHHIGIYLGGGQMVHAPDFGRRVEVTTLTGSYWSSQTWTAARFG